MDGDRRQPSPQFSMNGQGDGTLRVAPHRTPDGIALRLTGEMDIATAPHLVEGVRSLSRPDLQHVRLDLTQLTFIDASGLRALVEARMLVHGQGGRLSLHGARLLLRRMLQITKLNTAFDLESDLTTPPDR